MYLPINNKKRKRNFIEIYHALFDIRNTTKFKEERKEMINK